MNHLSCYELPMKIREKLYLKGIQQFEIDFKHTKYLILSNSFKSNRIFFLQIINNTLFYVCPSTLRTNVYILTLSLSMVKFNEDFAAEQIANIVKDDFSEYPPYPTTSNTPDFFKNILVGHGIYPWPKCYFAPFVDVTAWPMYHLDTFFEPSKSNLFTLGFITSESPCSCNPTWGEAYPIDSPPIIKDIKKLRDHGGDISISFGGGKGTPLHVSCPTPELLAEVYFNIVMMYQVNHIDFSIEGPWVENLAANIRNSQALVILQNKLAHIDYPIDISFSLPASLSGISKSALSIVRSAISEGVNINCINGLAINLGTAEDSLSQLCISTLKSLHSNISSLYSSLGVKRDVESIWASLGITPMIGKNPSTGEIFSLSDCNALLSFATSVSLKQVSMWACNLDTPLATGLNYKENSYTSWLSDFGTS